MAVIAAGEDLARRHADAKRRLGRHRLDVGEPPYAIGSEQCPRHNQLVRQWNSAPIQRCVCLNRVKVKAGGGAVGLRGKDHPECDLHERYHKVLISSIDPILQMFDMESMIEYKKLVIDFIYC
jgi:hypothetical protein